MHHPITRLGQLESVRYIRYTTNGGRTWTFAQLLDQPKQRRGGKVGYEAACEVHGKSTLHQFFFITEKVLRDPNCIIQQVTPKEVAKKRFAQFEGKPRRSTKPALSTISVGGFQRTMKSYDGGITWTEPR